MLENTDKAELVQKTSMPVGVCSLGAAVGFAVAARLVELRVDDAALAWTLLDMTTGALVIAIALLAFFAASTWGERQ